MRARAPAVALVAAMLLGGCGHTAGARGPRPAGIPAALLREMRPIGRGPRFEPPVRGPMIGPCRAPLGARFGVHIEVFAANRVVIVPAGIGTEPPRHTEPDGVLSARCYGTLVTVQPTGVVLVRRGVPPTLAQLFRAWGQPLTRARLASFSGGRVRTYIAGRRAGRPPDAITLARHAEIVVEIGPYVPPHRSFAFPPGI